ncbi:hypothetical protein M0813_17616 [Anaeramoeba flamelloides]|uniref:DUF659 domain-containing protein n=1 Tax=Anaeramoeba flamelloides TaxID=1746091 RepID=A0ABQ8YUZ3_9EUKA|nr:hypothetical protein M0813_17616 [Anaeramoeba flamelloides]
MHWLLNNVHCSCGQKKELVDLKEGYGSFRAILVCRNCKENQFMNKTQIFDFSNKLDQNDEKDGQKKAKFKTEIGKRKIIASVLAGNFFENYREHMEMLGLSYLKKNAYYKTIDMLIRETNGLFQKHIEENRKKMDLKNLIICVDAGWSSRRNANECCFIVIDNKTKLLFDLIIITREHFSGASGNMEAEAARIFCNKHKDNINLVGVIKDGDTKLATIFETTWKQVKIFKDLNHLLKNIRRHLKEIAKYRSVKKIITPLCRWIRLKCETSWSSLELSINIELINFIGWKCLMKLLKNVIFFNEKNNLHNINIGSVQDYEIEKQNLYKLSPQLIQLNEIITELSEQSKEFFEAGSTNKCESFMNSRTKFVEKRFNITKQWEMRCQFSALNRELPEWKTILMEQIEKVSKSKKVQDVMNLNKKNEAFINLSVYINEFEKTFKIKKNLGEQKTLILNQDEYNGDIEIFKEIQENEEINEFVEEKIKEKSVLNDKDLGGNRGYFNQ